MDTVTMMSSGGEPVLSIEKPRIFLSATEVSGDFQAGHLARALRRRSPEVVLSGNGGHHMRAAGVRVEIQVAHLGYIGLQEAVRFERQICRRLTEVKKLLKSQRPDLVVLVDGERFNEALVPFLIRQEIPFIYYFVPQVWFWGRWRTRRIARKARLVIPAFPAEESLFRKAKARVIWCGHSLLDIVRPTLDRSATLRSAGLDPSRPVVALMPGSRLQEIERFAPSLFSVASRLARERPELQFLLPVAAPHLEKPLRDAIGSQGIENLVTFLSCQDYSCLSSCDLALLSSGTATLEAALLEVPMVVFYRVHPVTFLIASILVKSRYIAMPNILLQDEVVPELLQNGFTTDKLFEEAIGLLTNRERRAFMKLKLSGIRELLGGSGVLDRVASAILSEIGKVAVSQTKDSAMTDPTSLVKPSRI